MPTETATPAHDSPAAPETAAPETVNTPSGDQRAEQSTDASPGSASGESGARPQVQTGGQPQKGQATGKAPDEFARPCTGIEAHAVATHRMTGKWPQGYSPSKRAKAELARFTGSADGAPGASSPEGQGAEGSDEPSASPGGQGEGADDKKTPGDKLSAQYGEAEGAKAGDGTVLMAADFELVKRGFSDGDMLDMKPDRRIALAAKFRAQRNAGNPGRSQDANLPGSRNAVAPAKAPPAEKAQDPTSSQVQTDDPLAGAPQSVRDALELMGEDEAEDLRAFIASKASKPDPAQQAQQPQERVYSEGEQKLAHRNMRSVAQELSTRYPTLKQPGAWEAFSQRLMEYAEQIGTGDEMLLDIDLLSQSADRVYAVFSAHDIRAAKTAKAGQQAAANRGGAMPAPKGGGQGQSGVLRSAPTNEQHIKASFLAAQECRDKHGSDKTKLRALYDKHIREIVGTA